MRRVDPATGPGASRWSKAKPEGGSGLQTVTLVVIGDGGSEAGQLEAGLDGASGGVLRVAGRAGDRRAGADLVRRRRPDVAVVDLAGRPAAPS